jgi:HSP20 family molecular chaperone IbpA
MFQVVSTRPAIDIEQLFGGLFDQFRHSRATASLRPVLPVSVTAQTDTYTLTAQLPEGIQKEHVGVELHDGVLSLTVKKELAKHNETDEVVFDERRAIDVSRRFDFGDGVSSEGHTAKVADGVLTVVLKKSTERAPQKLLIE